MLSNSLETLKQIAKEPQDLTSLLKSAWKYMPEGMRQTVSTEPIIPAVVARAKTIAAQNPDFIRSDQGQIIGIFPEKEVLYGPSSGLEELRQLVARFWTLAYQLSGRPGFSDQGLDRNHVAIVSGATEGLAIVLRLFSYKQNVGLMRLYWSNYKGIILNAGGNPVVVNLFDNDDNFDLETAEVAIEENNINSLLINFPANPSGDVLAEDELADLAELARRLDLIIISDEVYNYLRYKGEPQSMLRFAPERTVVIGAASKEYLIPGARVGYVLAANKTFASSWMPKLIRSSSSSPNVLGQRLLIDILREEVEDLENDRPPRFISKIKEELGKRRDLMISALKEKGFSLAGRDKDFPSGAISLLVELPRDITTDDKTFVEKGLELEKFSAIPGSVFGAPGCIRVGYAGMTPATIKRLSQNLQDVLDFFRKDHRGKA